MRCSIAVSLLLALLVTAPAYADTGGDEPVRQDIVDLRHQRLPARRVFLGWTADRKAVVHVASCGSSDGGGPFCEVSLEITGAKRAWPQSVPLLQPACSEPCTSYDDGFPWTVPTELASRAIRAERAALAKLGPLQPSASAPPLVRLEPDRQYEIYSCRVKASIDGRQRLTLLALGDQCIYDGGGSSLNERDILDVQLSPDRHQLAITLRVTQKSEEYSNQRDHLRVFDLAP